MQATHWEWEHITTRTASIEEAMDGAATFAATSAITDLVFVCKSRHQPCATLSRCYYLTIDWPLGLHTLLGHTPGRQILWHSQDMPISNLMPGQSTGKKKITGEYGNGRITLSFQLECWDHFYGRNCDVYCRPTNDSRGHFTCGLNGEIVCLMGWQDPANHCLTRKDVLFTTKFSLCQAVCSKNYRMC